jgi:hypothetical protein
MAKAPTTSSPGVPAPERDLLVATKFHVPRAGDTRAGTIERAASLGVGLSKSQVSAMAAELDEHPRPARSRRRRAGGQGHSQMVSVSSWGFHMISQRWPSRSRKYPE